MENKKQTAVEWLIYRIKNQHLYPETTIDELEKQAKEMEKDHTTRFANNFVNDCVNGGYNGEAVILKDSEQYYNERYGNKS